MLTFYPQDCALVYEIQHQLLFGMSLCFVQKNEEGAHQARNFKSFVRCINPGRIRIHLAIHSDGDGNPRLAGVAIVFSTIDYMEPHLMVTPFPCLMW